MGHLCYTVSASREASKQKEGMTMKVVMVECYPIDWLDMNAAFSEIDDAMSYVQREARQINARQAGDGWTFDTKSGEATCDFVSEGGDEFTALCLTYKIDDEL